ncbi:MAG: NrdD-like anaerobic ribonucleotide reductase large subunit [Wendovervirus sonii]|uniref:NrdD-like anaerobic ribonucleotide reductase large subunit n=1 Tax=phage Lak_Megaphage_Sonny TaxID=3109229 RepID=A0ABZ0Z292_9CAUD|nr:MAG: NrdD-like anaerobic ribonucleotide reductase large subunit [phage Lak_Megaphage_Sonny]
MKELKVNMEAQPIEYFSTMGCRTVNGHDINFMETFKYNIEKLLNDEDNKVIENYTSAAQKDGRGNICPVTIIMPTIAMMAKEQEGDIVSNFMVVLDKKIHEAKDMLLERFYYISSQSPASAKFMYENNTMGGYIPEEGIVSALKHGTIVIGQLGLSETLYILIGKDHTTSEGMELAKRIEKLFNTRCAEFKKDYHMNFGVYYTPAENLCYTALKKWKEQYGEMENVTYYMDGNQKIEKKFFTNSMHVPVWKEISPFEKIDIESQLTGYSNAGCITYVEVQHEVIHNIDALESLVNYAMDKDIPYFAINCPADCCEDCGYQGQIDEVCPKCGSAHISRLRRVTGYLTGDYTTAFNKGKQNEVELRVKHQSEIKFCNENTCTCNDD